MYQSFLNFFHFVWPQCKDSGYLVSATPHTIVYRSFWNFAHVLEMWIWFGYNPCINFCHFFNFVIFWRQILWKCRQWVTCESNSSYNFIPIFLKLCACFLHGLELCMWFGYNPWINFCHFFHSVNFVIFWQCIDNGYLVSATPYTISYLSLIIQLCTSFFHVLKMCMVWI